MNAPIYNRAGIARTLTAEEVRAIAIGRARDNVRKWENIVDAMTRPNRWAKNRLAFFRAVLAATQVMLRAQVPEVRALVKAIGRARDNVRKWENIVDAMTRPNRIRWAKNRLAFFRAVLADLEASAP